jgi:hypothetical protein
VTAPCSPVGLFRHVQLIVLSIVFFHPGVKGFENQNRGSLLKTAFVFKAKTDVKEERAQKGKAHPSPFAFTAVRV